MRFFLLIVLILGIFFRFTYLDHKVYWYDEAITSVRASGYTEQEVVQHFSQKSIVSVTELQHYQHPDGTRSIIDTAKSLVKEDPQHPPLYYGLLHFWFKSIGSSPTLSRLLSVLLSLLAFPSAYWLCQELFIETGVFTSRLPNYLMIGLIAVSQFHVLYAQESRQYTLWIVTTLLSNAALLRAIRVNTGMSWGIYTFTVVINFYTFLLAGLTMIAQGLYIILVYGFSHIKILKNYIISFLLSAIFFVPYIWILIINQSQAEKGLEWTVSNSVKRSDLTNVWIQHLGRIFFNVNQDPWDFYIHRVLLVLCVYALYCLCRQTPMSVWLLIILLIAANTLPLMLPDWILGGSRSTPLRYMIPSLLGVQLAITYLLGRNLASPSLKFWHEKFWQLLLVILVSGSILSCTVSSQATVNKFTNSRNEENIAIAKVVNQTTHPLLISDQKIGDLLSLSHSLKPTVQILLKPSCNACQIQYNNTFEINLPEVKELEQFSEVFLYRYYAGEEWFKALEKQQNYKFEPVVFAFAEWAKNRPMLWKVIPSET